MRAYVLVRGIVQGVGFRPFVHRIARANLLNGWVLNSTEGVEIEVEGHEERVRAFLDDLSLGAPPMASIHRVDVHYLPPAGYSSFIIESSQEAASGSPLVSPDIATCPDCLSELFAPSDRRHRYPFINCTNCGPRFTIVEGVPYDRPKTTMKAFSMCPACLAEYDDPEDRRFHAQPNACRECGPRVWLLPDPSWQDAVRAPSICLDNTVGHPHPNPLPLRRERGLDGGRRDAFIVGDAIRQAKALLNAGRILAVKGIGGFHLACDATNPVAVSTLRERKRRVEKPFAIMARDLDTVQKLCYCSDAEAQLLSSARRPIVLLDRRPEGTVAPQVAPRNRRLGVMLPYTPIHHLLLEQDRDTRFEALVMTSGNLSEEPIARDNDEALSRLHRLADYFLLHDRPIHVRCDDPVTQVFDGKEMVIRRSRGYAPLPIRLDLAAKAVLACGADLKSAFCLADGNYAFLSQHIGDLENQETLDFFAGAIDHFSRLFNLRPRLVAHDLHPEYLSSRYARSLLETPAPPALVAVQHHHAHIAGCMAENGLSGPVIGVAFDGTGYGLDGTIWGGEFLMADYSHFERLAHLQCVRLPGGEAAIRKPYRTALSYLVAAYGQDLPEAGFLERLDPYEVEVVRTQVARGINSPLTSSCGRLFDAVSALIGIRGEISYEGQAAIELEMAARSDVDAAYPFGLSGTRPLVIDAAPTIRSIVEDVRMGEDPGAIAAKFHNGLARMVGAVCVALRASCSLNRVCLSGGVFQNRFLLSRTLAALAEAGFETYIHHLVPCNDGGIALGQAMVASRMERVQDA